MLPDGAPDATADRDFIPTSRRCIAAIRRFRRLGTLDCRRTLRTAAAAMPSAPARLIAHLDMDAFYASVELLRYPELTGRPVVIGGGRRHQPQASPDPATGQPVRTFATLRNYAGRGVITTATYEARALGLHSAMGLMKAAQLAPDAVLLPVDFDAYRKYSRLFKDAVRAIAPRIQDNGIDEIYVDLTDVHPAEPASARASRRAIAWERARDGRAVDQGRRARGDRAFLLDRRRAEQAPRQDRLRARQAGRADASSAPATSSAASGRCPRAGSTASGRSRARSSRRSACARSRSSPPPTRRGSSSISGARTARSCTTPRTAATSGTSSP